MLTRIVRPSPALQAFLKPLTAHLSQPQRQHLLELADALLVCADRKTLAALQRQFLEATDPSNWADFLRLSPWSADRARDTLRRRHLAWLLDEAQRRGLPKVVFLNLDDSLGKKDRHTCCLEPVDWFHDHNESTPQRPRYHKAFCYLECTANALQTHGKPRSCARKLMSHPACFLFTFNDAGVGSPRSRDNARRFRNATF